MEDLTQVVRETHENVVKSLEAAERIVVAFGESAERLASGNHDLYHAVHGDAEALSLKALRQSQADICRQFNNIRDAIVSLEDASVNLKRRLDNASRKYAEFEQKHAKLELWISKQFKMAFDQLKLVRESALPEEIRE